MSDLPWVRFFPSDWLGGTRGMSAAETGVYITLVATMYERGEPVPEDHPRLARLCGAALPSFRTVLEALVAEGKIIRTEAGLWNERVDKERAHSALKSESARSAGLASARSKLNAPAAENTEEKQDVNGTDVAPTFQRGANGEATADQLTRTRIEKETPDGVSKNGAGGAKAELEAFRSELSQQTDTERIEAFIKLRRQKRGASTALAARLFVADAKACGMSVTEAIDACVSRNWITVKPEYFAGRRQHDPPVLPSKQPTIPDEQRTPEDMKKHWLGRLDYGRIHRKWISSKWGPMPGASGCLVPAELLQPGDGQDWGEYENGRAA